MSFNQHILPALTRTNYEEAFLLYVDGELTPDQLAAVDAFVLLHPDLKEELDLLCSTKLPAESFSFAHKEALLAGNMAAGIVDESLLLYIDDELPAAEKAAVEERLKQDSAFALQHTLLMQTKLLPEVILHPDKKSLYRRTERRIAPVWMRAAAAVLIVAGSGAVWLGLHQKNTTPDVAVVAPKKNIPAPSPVATPPENKPDQTTAKTAVAKITTPEKGPLAVATAVEKKRSAKRKIETFSNPHIAQAPVAPSNDLPKPEEVVAVKITAISNSSAVTSETVAPYVLKEAPALNTNPVAVVSRSNNDSRGGGSVKGMLRKATRFLERHTGIKAVNDDNELLVGAVAIKL